MLDPIVIVVRTVAKVVLKSAKFCKEFRANEIEPAALTKVLKVEVVGTKPATADKVRLAKTASPSVALALANAAKETSENAAAKTEKSFFYISPK